MDGSDFQNLINTLSKFAGDTVFELTEVRLDYEIEIAELDQESSETIYTDKNNNWIVYTSHEGTIAFGGEELLNELNVVLADKSEFRNTW